MSEQEITKDHEQAAVTAAAAAVHPYGQLSHRERLIALACYAAALRSTVPQTAEAQTESEAKNTTNLLQDSGVEQARHMLLLAIDAWVGTDTAETHRAYLTAIDALIAAVRAAHTPTIQTECCAAPIHEDWRYCPTCGQECHVEAVEPRYAAVRAENTPLAEDKDRCMVCRAVYPSGGQHAGVPWSMRISGRGICKRCVGAARDARRADESDASQPHNRKP